jgi:hypothetical protein
MATDIHQKAMYLIHLDCHDTKARFDWIREFSMPWNTIGFNISSATTIKFVDAVAKGLGPSSKFIIIIALYSRLYRFY